MLHSQEFNVQLETEFGTAQAANIAIVSTSAKALGTKVTADIMDGMRKLFEQKGMRVMAVGCNESIVVDILLP